MRILAFARLHTEEIAGSLDEALWTSLAKDSK